MSAFLKNYARIILNNIPYYDDSLLQGWRNCNMIISFEVPVPGYALTEKFLLKYSIKF
jgi:hypothetical protein